MAHLKKNSQTFWVLLGLSDTYALSVLFKTGLSEVQLVTFAWVDTDSLN